MAACEFCSFLPISRLQDGAGQCYNKPGFYAVLGIPVDMPVFNSCDSDSLAVMPQNLVHGFRLSAGRPDNRFIGQKVRILHVKAPPFLCAEAVKSCGFDTRWYSGSVRTFPRFPAVCNA